MRFIIGIVRKNIEVTKLITLHWMFFLSYLNLCLFISKSISFIKSYFKPYWLFRCLYEKKKKKRSSRAFWDVSVNSNTAFAAFLPGFLIVPPVLDLRSSACLTETHAPRRAPNVSPFHVHLCHALFRMRLSLLPAHVQSGRSASGCVWIPQMSVWRSSEWFLHHICVCDDCMFKNMLIRHV